VTMRRAAFPIWRVTRDGSEIPSRGPFIQFDATPGLYRIERVTIWQESVGAATSLIGLLVLGFIMSRRRHFDRRPAPASVGIVRRPLQRSVRS